MNASLSRTTSRTLLIAVAVALICSALAAQTSVTMVQAMNPSGVRPQPRLVLQIAIDQLRGDEPFRYRDRFGEGGFRFLMDRGAWYRSANHPHSHTETVVGHTTLATGAYPSRHGMIGNSWYDRETGKIQYSVEDDQTTIVGTPDKGASPRRIQTTTFSDELNIKTAGHARIFAVSNKDRAAIPLAGHTGKAYWLSLKSGDFVTSTYYLNAYPEWVTNWNKQRRVDQWVKTTYDLLHDRATYLMKDMPIYASPLFDAWGYKRTFPHYFDGKPGQLYYNELYGSPFGDQLTLEFVEELVRQEHVGASGTTDYLGISFSSTDIVGHNFSVSSLESEDNLLRLDRTLAALFAFIDKQVGLDNTLIVLAGDHGAPEIPEYLTPLGVPAGRLDANVVKETAAAALQAKYGRNDLILNFLHPYFYLNHAAIADAKLDELEVERTVVTAVMTLEGVDLAISCTELRRGGEEMDSQIIAEVRRNQHPKRSGDVYVIQLPQWQVSTPSQYDPTILQHGSPWAYDTFVPIVFLGTGVPAGQVFRQVYTVDIVATLAAYIATDKPSGLAGTPLTEVTGGR